MSSWHIRRAAGAFSAVVVAAGFAVTVGAGVADAAANPNPKSWSSGLSKYTRTISNVNPHAGDTITVTTKFERKAGGVFEKVWEFDDVYPACLTFESAKVDGKSVDLESQDDDDLESEDADVAQIKGSWFVRPYFSPKSHTFEFTYEVGADCGRNTELKTGMHYDGTLGEGTFNTKGPAIKVGLDSSTTDLAAAPSDLQVGRSAPLTATVTGGAKGDTVEFYDGATKIGTTALDKKGVAALAWIPDTEGEHTLSAKYLATSRVAGSQSGVQTVQVSPIPDAETRTVLLGPSTAQTGTEVIFGSQVSPTPEGGTVQFIDGDTDLGDPVPVDADGKASITHTFDSEGTHDITAVYSGEPGVSGSTAEPVTVTVTDEDGGPDDGDGGTGDGGTGSAGNIFGS
ncbi:Ig-like domain-containing protein [Rhodococcus marinonascens]|uniref:Ig-like domain-containing protein n=1 Tax=Rhodococcus marinonascens TaxID=38311 RepID=UPI000AE15D03|nr:Ig-like domain-containing protein [Rhodococcus marinonascens]